MSKRGMIKVLQEKWTSFCLSLCTIRCGDSPSLLCCFSTLSFPMERLGFSRFEANRRAIVFTYTIHVHTLYPHTPSIHFIHILHPYTSSTYFIHITLILCPHIRMIFHDDGSTSERDICLVYRLTLQHWLPSHQRRCFVRSSFCISSFHRC